MTSRKVFFLCAALLLIFPAAFAAGNNQAAQPAVAAAAPESDQQISDFSLAGYGEKGKKTWDLNGKSADIFDDVVKLKEINGNMYGSQETVHLTAEKGDFNKNDGRMFLEENVVITTSSGAKLTTDSLEWDRKNGVVNTEDPVNIVKEEMVTTAIGAQGKPDLNKVDLKKDVRVELSPKKEAGGPAAPVEDEKIVIICDGPMEVDYAVNVAVFKNNVKVERSGSEIYSDLMEIYFASGKTDKSAAAAPAPAAGAGEPALMGSKIDKLVCRGNVKIVRGQNVSYSDEAIYTSLDKKITLIGRPKLIIYSTDDLKATMMGN